MFSADISWTPIAESKKELKKEHKPEQERQPHGSTQSNKISRRRPWQFRRKNKEGESSSSGNSIYNDKDVNSTRSPSLAHSTLQEGDIKDASYLTQTHIEGISEAP